MTTRRAFSVTSLDRFDYMVHDMGRAITFYRDVLGLEPLVGFDENGAEFELPDGAVFGCGVAERSSRFSRAMAQCSASTTSRRRSPV